MDWLAKETDLASVSISDESASLEWFATKRHGDGVVLRVAAAHRLAPPVLSHDNSFWSWAENEFSAKWGVSIPMTLGETPASAVAKADIIYIYIYQIIEVRVKWPYKDCYKA